MGEEKAKKKVVTSQQNVVLERQTTISLPLEPGTGQVAQLLRNNHPSRCSVVRIEKCSKNIKTLIDADAPMLDRREVSGSKLPPESRAQQRSGENHSPHPDPGTPHHTDVLRSGTDDIHTPSRDEVEAESESILKSKAFARSPRLRHLLAHILRQWVDGNTNRLDGYNIAIDVFQRDTFFDSGLDPIVRVEIARLRKQLAKYYETEAQGNAVRIEIPKGRYVPVFFRQAKALESETVEDQTIEGQIVQGVRATSVLVLPFTVEGEHRPISLYDHLLCQLTQEPGLRVVSRSLAVHLAEGRSEFVVPQQAGPHLLIEGCASCVGEQYHMILHVSNSLRGYNVWSGRYTTTANSIAEMMSLAVRDLAKAMHAAALLS